MNKIDQPKVYIDLAKDNYVLTRVEDNKQIPASIIKFIEWNEDGTGKRVHDEPSTGRSIAVDPTTCGYKWLTTQIIEMISENEFKTKNSTYKLYKL